MNKNKEGYNMLYVIKRDGTRVPFNRKKIEDAINKAFLEVDKVLYETDTAYDISKEIENEILEEATIEEIAKELQVDEVESVHWLKKSQIEELMSKGLVRKSSCEHYNKFIR